MSTPDTQMNQYLTTIAEAVHGRDMRAAIHDGMEKTYNDSYAWFNQSLGNANQALQKATEALEIAEPMGDDIQEIKDLAEDLDTKYDETNERVNNIIAHNQDTQGNSELIDLRTTYDGQIKTSAGTAVRSQISNLHSRINNLVREQSTGELEDCHAKPVYVPLYENQYPSSAFAAQTLQLSLPGSPVPSLAKYAFIKITFKDSNLFGAGVRSVYIPNPGKDAEATNIYTSDGHVTMPADGTYGLNSYSRKFTAALSSNDTVLNIMFTDCEKIATDNPFAIDNSDMTISDPSSTTTTDNEYLIPYEVFLIDYVLDGEIEIDKDTELIDIRNGEDGTTYQSAGAAVRGQVVSAKNKTASTQSMIAPLYSVSGTYAAGDYVNYGDKLYKAKQAISSEAWTASHWDEVNVMDEVDSDVGELKSALTTSGIVETVDFTNAITDKVINKVGGISDSEGFSYITNVSVKKGDMIVLTARGYLDNIAMIAKKISNTQYTPLVISSAPNEVKKYIYTATEDMIVGLSFRTASTHLADIILDVSLIRTDLYILTDEYEETYNAFNRLNDEIGLSGLVKQLSFDNEIEGFINNSGEITLSNNFYRIEVPTKKGDSIYFEARGYLTAVAMIAIKNNDNTYTPKVISIDTTVRKYTYTAETDCIIVLSYNKSHPHSASLVCGVADVMSNPLDLFSIFETFGACGDSLISGFIETASGNINDAVTNYDLSWAKQIAIICGNEYTHYSYGGANAKTWLETFGNTVQPKDAYLVALGTNDYATLSLGTPADIGTQADTFYRYYGEIISLLKNINPNAKIFVCSIYRNEGERPIWNAAIKYFADNNTNVYYLDFTSMTDKFGTYKNGSHFTAIGYKLIAKEVSDMISNIIKTEWQEFRYVGTY